MFDNDYASHTINITSAIISNGIIEMGSYPFYECTTLKYLKLSDNFTKIDEGGLVYGCSGLTSITIPSSTISLGDGWGQTFAECTSLNKIICLPKTKPSSQGSDIFENICPNGTLYVPKGCSANYADDNYWKLQSKGWKIVELP
jgi:hypothetical protein